MDCSRVLGRAGRKLRSIIVVALVGLTVSCDDPVLKPALIVIRSANDIVSVQGKWVRPIVYSNAFDFGSLTVSRKKKKFIQMMVPAILLVKHNIAVDRSRVGHLIWRIENEEHLDAGDSIFLNEKIKEYNAGNAKDLYQRMATHPTSIVLAQAAIESGWGSSRFFKEANNLFGIWSYNEAESRIKAGQGRESGDIYVRKYPDINASIEDYFKTLARVNAYAKFRSQRQTLEDPYKLIYFLNRYSERKYKYVADLSQVMKKNNLTQYDSLKLDPSYYRENDKITF
ncbi:BAX protein [Fulvivirga imtechensis AK7]|uniref:BAX protein n=2 Tax=Fulvivirga TaxID=396811 RepID=L8JYB0_9BACT|nr:BAX protein [Fulvivirga imtechensis AK7]